MNAALAPLTTEPMSSDYPIVQWALSITIPAAAALGGVLIGAWLTNRRERSARQHQFLVRQINELYAPLVGLRTEIRVRSDLRERIVREADAAWRELVGEARQFSVAKTGKVSAERGPEFKRIIEYDNRVLLEELIPTYRKMLTTLRDHLWLAEPETRVDFSSLLEFVELWERWLAKALPSEVLERMHHSEESLQGFYTHTEKIHDSLRVAISRGDTRLSTPAA